MELSVLRVQNRSEARYSINFRNLPLSFSNLVFARTTVCDVESYIKPCYSWLVLGGRDFFGL